MKSRLVFAKNNKELNLALKDTLVVLIFQIILIIALILFNIFGYTVLNLVDVLNLSILGYLFIFEKNRLFGFLLVFYQLVNFLNNFPNRISLLEIIFLIVYLKTFINLLYLKQKKSRKKVEKATKALV